MKIWSSLRLTMEKIYQLGQIYKNKKPAINARARTHTHTYLFIYLLNFSFPYPYYPSIPIKRLKKKLLE